MSNDDLILELNRHEDILSSDKYTGAEKFYCQILESLGVKILGDNYVLNYPFGKSLKTGEYELRPIKIKGKELVLPTKTNLKKKPEFWENRIAFHPMSEQVLRENSSTLRTLQTLISWKLILSISTLAKTLASIAAHPEITKLLNPKQRELLDAMVDAKSKTVNFVENICAASETEGYGKLIKTFIKRGGKHHNKQYKAVLITQFSLFDDNVIDLEKRTIMGVKAPRINDMTSVINLFKFIIPGSDDSNGETWNAASNDDTAPRLHVLLTGYAQLAHHLNLIYRDYADYIEGYENLILDLAWVTKLGSLSKMRHDIPALEDNYGEIKESKKIIPSNNKLEGNDANNDFRKSNKVTSKNHNVNFNTKQSNATSKQSNRSNTMTFNPMMMSLMNNNNSNNGNGGIDPAMLAMMGGGSVDPTVMMLMQNGNNDMDLNQLLMMQALGKNDGGIDPMTLMMLNQNKDGGGMDLNQLLMMQAMNKDGGGIDPMMLMMLNQNKDGDGIDPMMLMMLNQNKDGGGIDPMMLMMMQQNGDGGGMDLNQLLMMQALNKDGGNGIDPTMFMLMQQQNKAKKGETVTPKQPKPNYPKS